MKYFSVGAPSDTGFFRPVFPSIYWPVPHETTGRTIWPGMRRRYIDRNFSFSKRPKLTSSSNKLAWTCTGGLLKYLNGGENNYKSLSNIFVWLGHSKLISRLTGDCMKTLGRSVGIIMIIILELVYVWDTQLYAQKHGLYDINAFAWHLIVFKRNPDNPANYWIDMLRTLCNLMPEI